MDDTIIHYTPPEKHLLDAQWQVPPPPSLNVPEGSAFVEAVPSTRSTLVESVAPAQLTEWHVSERSYVSEGRDRSYVSEGQSSGYEQDQYYTNGDTSVAKERRSLRCTSKSSSFKELARSMLLDVAEELSRLAYDREVELRRQIKDLRDHTTKDHLHASVDNHLRVSVTEVETPTKKFIDCDSDPISCCSRKSYNGKIFDTFSLHDSAERFSLKQTTSTRQTVVKRSSSKQVGVCSSSRKDGYNYRGLIKILQEGDDRQDSNRFRVVRSKTLDFGVGGGSIMRGNSAWSNMSSLGWSMWDYMKDSLTRIRQRKENLEIVLDQLMGIVIILNTITIGVSCDVAEDSTVWVVLDSIYAILFLAEIILKVRILGYRIFFCGMNWGWNWLETLLVVFAWAEIGIQIMNSAGSQDVNVSTLRVIRIVRISRIVRVCRLPVMTDLVMMINGAIGGLKTLIWSILLIALPLYVVALLMRETIGRDESSSVQESFSTLPKSTFTLFRCVVAGDCTNKVGVPIFLHTGGIYSLVYVVTMLLMTFGLFNVIVAIYVENTVAAAKYNELHQKRQRLRDNKVFARKACDLVETVWQIYCNVEVKPDEFHELTQSAQKLGNDPHAIEIVSEIGNLTISLDFFEKLKQSREFQELLKDMDIADNDTMDLFETLDVDGSGTIDLAELLFGLRKLRGDPRRADVIANNLITRSILDECSSITALVRQSRSEDRVLQDSLKQALYKLLGENEIPLDRAVTKKSDVNQLDLS